MTEKDILEIIDKLNEYLEDDEGVESESIECALYELRDKIV